MMICCLPVLRLFGKRYRVRWRFIGAWNLWYKKDDFEPRGIVWRMWLGCVLVTVMIDRKET